MNSSGRVSTNRLAVVGTAVLCVLIILSAVFPISTQVFNSGFLSIGLRQAEANPGWLSGWDNRIKLTTNSSLIDSDLTHFPTTVFLNNVNGETSKVFDEVGMNLKKIAVADDSGTEFYVEIEQWQDFGKYIGNPVVPYGGTWDHDIVYPAVTYNADWPSESRYRMWYLGISYPGTKYYSTCYAYSSTGKEGNWTKPNLGLVSYGGNTSNNILLPLDYELGNAFYDFSTSTYYILVCGDPSYNTAAIYSSASPDGNFTLIKTLFQETVGANHYVHGFCLVKKPDDKWLCYCQHRDGSNYRSIWLWSSDTTDITGNWTDEGLCPGLDDNGVTDQKYSIDVWIDGGKYKGAVVEYNETAGIASIARFDSDDGKTWTRQYTWVPVGASGAWDDGAMWHGKFVPSVGGESRFYYSGSTEPHGSFPRNTSVGYITDLSSQAVLHFGKTGMILDGDADTNYYLYYDKDHADNANVGITNSAVAENVWDSNFKGIYHLVDGASTSSTYDSSTEDNDGTKKDANEPNETTSAKIGNAQDCDSANDHIYKASASFLSDTVGTVEGWFYIEDTASTIWGASDNTRADRFFYCTAFFDGADEDDDRLRIMHYDNAVMVYRLWTQANSLSKNTWHHIVVISSGTAISAYINNVLQTLTVNSGANNGDWFGDLTNVNMFSIAALRYNSGTVNTPMGGMIDEVRVSSTNRSAAWIGASYYSQKDSLLTYGSEEPLSAEITNTPDNYGFGVLAVNTTGNTTVAYFTLNNTGNCVVDVTIQGTNLTGGDDTWTLSGTATPGENIYGLYAGLDDGSPAFDVVVNATANAFVSDLAEDATQDWGLKLYMPMSVTNYDAQQMSGTVTLIASAA